MMSCLNISDTAIITIKSVTYSCILYGISKSEAINLFKNSVLEDHCYLSEIHIQTINVKISICNYHIDNLVKVKV